MSPQPSHRRTAPPRISSQPRGKPLPSQPSKECYEAQTNALQAAMCGEPLEVSLQFLLQSVARTLDEGVDAAFCYIDGSEIVPYCTIGSRWHESASCDAWPSHGSPPRNGWSVHSLRGCWSLPIATLTGQSWGTLEICWPEMRPLLEHDKVWLDRICHTAAIIISQHAEAEERPAKDRELHKREVQLLQSAETFANLVEQSPLGIYTIDSEFRLRHVSAGALPAFSNVQPLIGRDFSEVMRIVWPEPFASQAIEIFRHTLETGEPYISAGFAETRRDTGDYEAYEWQTIRIDMADGKPGVVCYFFDSTRLHQANFAVRESEVRFRMLADNMSQLAWMSDAQGQIAWYNRRWLQYTGTTLEQMQRSGWESVLHPDHLTRVLKRLQQAYVTGESWEDTFPLLGSDGRFRWFLTRAHPIHSEDGQTIRWFGTSTDVTEQLDLERALKEADRRKDEFLATLAHELRNPLAPIRNGLQAIKLASGNGSLIQQTHQMMERQVAQMTHLINDLMDLSRISLGRIVLEKARLDITEAIRNAVDTSRWLMEQHAHHLMLDLPAEPLYVDGDLTRLSQVFGNLLNNAAKYTDHGGRIVLKAFQDGDQVAISCSDNGVGIEVAMLDRVFDMFTQVDRSLERSHGGLGIGLNIVARLVRMHGGTITAESEGTGTGSTFTVRLPRAGQFHNTQTLPSSNTPETQTRARRVLIVDDNHDGAASLAMMMQLMGHETRTAHDGVDALAMTEQFRPHLILMDIGMPRMNGFDACRQIREQIWGREVIIVAQTGWSQEEDKRKAIECGFDSHLTKPVDIAVLNQLLCD